MGMFDFIKARPRACWSCGQMVSGWQSKDGPCLMKTIRPRIGWHFYSKCEVCGTWNEYKVTARYIEVERVRQKEEQE